MRLFFRESDGDFGIWNGSLTRFRLDGDGHFEFNGGNVGIGTTTPQNTLNVIGQVNVTGNLIVGTSASSRRLTMFSPNGTRFFCGVSNSGVWSCI